MVRSVQIIKSKQKDWVCYETDWLALNSRGKLFAIRLPYSKTACCKFFLIKLCRTSANPMRKSAKNFERLNKWGQSKYPVLRDQRG